MSSVYRAPKNTHKISCYQNGQDYENGYKTQQSLKLFSMVINCISIIILSTNKYSNTF